MTGMPRSMRAAAVEALISGLERDSGPIDILVNTTAIIRRADLPVHSEGNWRAVMATNLDAVWLLSPAARSVA